MSKDVTVLKTAVFGGFKKPEVLKYIEEIQSDAAEIKGQLDEKRKEAMELKGKIDSLELRLDTLNGVNEKLLEAEKENAELKAMLQSVQNENKRLTEKSSKLEEKAEKLRRAEKQIGAAYIDARRYSDELVDSAKLKAKDIGAVASQEVKKEANEIEQLLKDVDAISRKFSSSLEQLHKDVYALSTKLNNSASNLLGLHTDLNEVEGAFTADYTSNLPDGAVSIEETDDGSGLTIISYPPHTEFNEDLNIRPDGSFDFGKKEG